jgi:V8-like Glu-specific endopeptidase
MNDEQLSHDEYSPFANATGAADGRPASQRTGESSPWVSREEEGNNPDAFAPPDSWRWLRESELGEAIEEGEEGVDPAALRARPDGRNESEAGEALDEGEEKPTHNPKCTKSGIGIRGTDDRQPVADSLPVPCRWICQLWIRQRDSNGNVTETGATGVLVSPRHVLTVAHAISHSERDSRNQLVTFEATSIRVTPARHGSNRPFGTVDANLPARVSPGWSAKTMPADQDYALLTLDKRVGDATFKALGGAKLCYWGAKSCGHRAIAARVPPETLQGATAYTAGYPKDRGNNEKPMRATGVLSGVVAANRLMMYSADACQGQSGSPVWVNVDGERRLVGMLVKVLPTTTLALRVTREMCAQLRKWLGTESDAFRDEVAAVGASKPNAKEWGEDSAEAYNEADTEAGAWISASSSCRCRRAPDTTEAEWDTAGSDREADSYTADSHSESSYAEASYAEDLYEEPVSEDEEPYAEWDVASHGEEEGAGEEEWTELGEDEGGMAPYKAATRRVRVDSWGPEGDIDMPEQQVPPPPLRFLPFMANLAAPLDPGFYLANGQYPSAKTPLQVLVDAVGALPAARDVAFAVVDLTAGVASPTFAGVRHTKQVATGSVGKIAPMYAAFQLDEQMRQLKAATGAATLPDLWATARARWTATQSTPNSTAVTPFAGDIGRKGDLMTWKGNRIAVQQGTKLPNLEEIFTPAPPHDVKLRSGTYSLVGTRNACDEFVVLQQWEHDRANKLTDLRFVQRMKMMVGISDNRASGTCIDDLGFAYIASLMVHSGLWHPARGGGLWLAGNYANKTWQRSPLGGHLQNGTAGAVVTFMTLLAQNRLVNAASSGAMRALMLKGEYPGAGTRSPVESALASVPGRKSKVISKLGLLPGIVSDAAIVSRIEGGKSLHYAVAILGARNRLANGTVIGDRDIRQIAIALDNCIRRTNGLPP